MAKNETGWQCPICKNVWAPGTEKCKECAKGAVQVAPYPYYPYYPYYPWWYRPNGWLESGTSTTTTGTNTASVKWDSTLPTGNYNVTDVVTSTMPNDNITWMFAAK